MAEEKTVLELISEVDEFAGMHELFKDSDLDIALSRIVRLVANPDLNPISAAQAITKLQALASKFRVQAAWLKNVEKPKPGTTEYHRKNMLYSVIEALENLVASLKYLVRT